MKEQRHTDSKVDRRDFLKFPGATVAAFTAAETASAAETTVDVLRAPHEHARSVSRPNVARAGYEFFDSDESVFIEAAVDILIPSDSVGPGAKELDVAIYIDRQMAGAYGKGDRLYMEGSDAEGAPQQGYQLAMTPSELIRAGIADVNDYVEKVHGKTFAALSAHERIAVLTDLDEEKIELPTVPLATLFGLLLQLTVEGYFADPISSGNTDKAVWRIIGFPGADAMYMDEIGPFRNKPYAAEPMGIQDLI